MRVLHLTTGSQECGVRAYTEEFLADLPGENLLCAEGEGEDWPFDIDLAHCQFSGGAFSTPHLQQFRQQCRAHGIPFLVTLHNCLAHIRALDPEILFVHTPSSLAEAVRLGFPEERVIHIPHGVPNITRSQEPEPNLLGLFGFLLPHKGALEAIEALHQIRDKPFRLLLQMPFHPPNREKSERLAQEVRERIHHLDLNDRVEFQTEFLDAEALVQQLSRVETFLFPYSSDAAQASSAAARASLAYGRPAIVSDLPLFAGMTGVETCAPGDACALSQAIRRVYQGDRLQELAREAVAGREGASWGQVAEQVQDVYRRALQIPMTPVCQVLGSSAAPVQVITPERAPGQFFFRLRAGGRVPYSFSHVLCELGKELIRQGHRVTIETLALEHEREFESTLPAAAYVDWEISFTYPPRFRPTGHGAHYAEVLCWETTYYPEHWANLAHGVERILTLSDFSRQALIASGVSDEKISVIPGGIDAEIFMPEGERVDWTSYGAAENATVFFHMGALDSRKGTPELIRAYLQAFHQGDNVLLFIKNNSFAGYYNLAQLIDQEIQARPNAYALPPLIVHRSEDWPAKVLAAHMRAATFGVFPYKGEGGFGLCSLELMACGVPMMLSNFGAPLEYAKQDCLLIGGELVSSQFKSGHHIENPKAEWFEVNGQDLTELLQLAHRMKRTDWQACSERVAEVAREYTWRRSVTRLIEALKER